jgi:hypothetical protein
MRSILLGATCALAVVAFGAPAFADCSKDAMMVKESAMKTTDMKKKEMAMKHVAMAEEKAKGKMEKDCMAEVMKAKEALK